MSDQVEVMSGNDPGNPPSIDGSRMINVPPSGIVGGVIQTLNGQNQTAQTLVGANGLIASSAGGIHTVKPDLITDPAAYVGIPDTTGSTSGNNAISSGNNKIEGIRFRVPFRKVFKKLQLYLVAGQAAALGGLGIYSILGAKLLKNAAGLDFSASSVAIGLNDGTGIELYPGFYLFLWTCSDATVAVRKSALLGGMIALLEAFDKNLFICNEVSVAGVIPDAIDPAVFTDATLNPPQMVLS